MSENDDINEYYRKKLNISPNLGRTSDPRQLKLENLRTISKNNLAECAKLAKVNRDIGCCAKYIVLDRPYKKLHKKPRITLNGTMYERPRYKRVKTLVTKIDRSAYSEVIKLSMKTHPKILLVIENNGFSPGGSWKWGTFNSKTDVFYATTVPMALDLSIQSVDNLYPLERKRVIYLPNVIALRNGREKNFSKISAKNFGCCDFGCLFIHSDSKFAYINALECGYFFGYKIVVFDTPNKPENLMETINTSGYHNKFEKIIIT